MKAFSLPAVAAGLALAACQPAAEDAPASPAAAPQAPAPAAPAAPPAAAPDAALTRFLETYARDAMAPVRYVARTHGEGPDALTLVYLSGPEYCGSGGCDLLILGRRGETYAVLGDVSVARTPIRVLETRSNGRPDIGVHVAGGGVVDGYEARLAFNGSRYPSNPTTAPTERVDNAPGAVLIDDDAEAAVLKE